MADVTVTAEVLTLNKRIMAVTPDDGCVRVLVHNEETKAIDTFELKFAVEGSTYTLLLSKQVEGRMKGLASVRELIANIGEDP